MNIRSVLLILTAVRQTKNISGQSQSLERFLRSYVGDTSTAGKQDARYSAAFVNLNRDGSQQVIVYLTVGEWCGSGGCTTLVLVPKDSTYKVQTKMTVTRIPLRVLSTTTTAGMIALSRGTKRDFVSMDEISEQSNSPASDKTK